MATSQYGKSRALNLNRSDIGGLNWMRSASVAPPTTGTLGSFRRPDARHARPEPGVSRRSGVRVSLARDRRLEVRCEELVADLLERAVGLHLAQRVVHRGDEIRALREDEPELL